MVILIAWLCWDGKCQNLRSRNPEHAKLPYLFLYYKNVGNTLRAKRVMPFARLAQGAEGMCLTILLNICPSICYLFIHYFLCQKTSLLRNIYREKYVKNLLN